MNYVNQFLDSHIKVDRVFLEHIVAVLEGNKTPEAKQQLIQQLKKMIDKNIKKIISKNENRSINKPLFG